MSISFVGSPTGSPVTQGPSTTFTVAQTGGVTWQTGDFLLTFLAAADQSTLTPPAGTTTIANVNGINVTGRTIQSGDGTSFNFTVGSSQVGYSQYAVYRSSFGLCTVDKSALALATYLTPAVQATFGADWLLLFAAANIVSSNALHAAGGTVNRFSDEFNFNTGYQYQLSLDDFNAPVNTAGTLPQYLYTGGGLTAEGTVAITLSEGSANSIVMVL